MFFRYGDYSIQGYIVFMYIHTVYTKGEGETEERLEREQDKARDQMLTFGESE